MCGEDAGECVAFTEPDPITPVLQQTSADVAPLCTDVHVGRISPRELALLMLFQPLNELLLYRYCNKQIMMDCKMK